MTLVKALAIFLFFILLAIYPQTTASSALNALNLWWNNVIPALLPFFMAAELLINIGVMNCLSIWLTPVMRPLFKLPGAAALAVVMGFVSGAPTGATIAAKLRETNLCTGEEGARLLAFTNNCSPLFILITISVATLHSPEMGMWLLLSHYPVNLLLGIILGFFAPKKIAVKNKKQALFQDGLQALRDSPKLPLGELLSVSIKKALSTIITIGGFIVFFAVLTAILEETGILAMLGLLFQPFLSLLGLTPTLSEALAHGLFETTIGIAKLPQAQATIIEQTIAASIIIAWNGLSIQAQVAAMVHHTRLKLNYYFISRIIHSILAPLVIIAAMPYIQKATISAPPIAQQITPFALLLLALGILMLLAVLGLCMNKLKKV